MPCEQSAHEMILEMIAWRDPNVVPVAAFYGDDLKVNFAGKLATDPHPLVSRPPPAHTLPPTMDAWVRRGPAWDTRLRS